MLTLVILGVVVVLIALLTVVAHRQDLRRKRRGGRGDEPDFERTQGDILGQAGNTASGTGTGIGPFGGPGP